MININKDELNSLDLIGYGCFGVVYRKDDKIYKVYRDEVKNVFKEPTPNPLLKHPTSTIRKLNRLIDLNRKVKHTDLIEDLLYIDGKFYGVVMPYYEGKLFLNLRELPIEERINYAKELVRNAKELTRHNIYLLDHRLKNVMLVNGNVKIIDADDYYSRVSLVKNGIYYLKSVSSLDDTLKSLFNEYSRPTFKEEEITKRLKKTDYKRNNTYHEIDKYIDYKSKKCRLLFIDTDFDLSDERLIDGSKVVIICNSLNIQLLLNTIDRLNARGISIYDVIDLAGLDHFINNNASSECLYVEHNKVLTLK